MTVTGRELIHILGDHTATYYLLSRAPFADDHETIRVIAGASLGLLGYTLGPSLEERARALGEEDLMKITQSQLVYTAAGAAIGGIMGYLTAKGTYDPERAKRLLEHDHLKELVYGMPSEKTKEFTLGDTIFTLGAALWLGHAFVKREQTPEERHRMNWGIGAGTIGYLAGPMVIQQLAGVKIPGDVPAKAERLYRRGTTLLGGILGGTAGWYMAKEDEHARHHTLPQKV